MSGRSSTGDTGEQRTSADGDSSQDVSFARQPTFNGEDPESDSARQSDQSRSRQSSRPESGAEDKSENDQSTERASEGKLSAPLSPPATPSGSQEISPQDKPDEEIVAEAEPRKVTEDGDGSSDGEVVDAEPKKKRASSSRSSRTTSTMISLGKTIHARAEVEQDTVELLLHGAPEEKPRLRSLIKTLYDVMRFLLNPIVAISLVVAAAAQIVCSPRLLNFRSEIEVGPIVTGFIFPLIFITTSTWQRAESSRLMLSRIQSSLYSTFWTHQEWLKYMPENEIETDFGTGPSLFSRTDHLSELALTQQGLLYNLCMYLSGKAESRTKARFRLYSSLRNLSALNERMGHHWGYKRSGGLPGMSRLAALHKEVSESIDVLFGNKDTGTPYGLRLFAWISALVVPILLAPHYAYLSCQLDELEDGLVKNCSFTSYGGVAGLVLYTLIVGVLLQITLDLEDPFDGKGPDDVDLEEFYCGFRELYDIPPFTLADINFDEAAIPFSKKKHGTIRRYLRLINFTW